SGGELNLNTLPNSVLGLSFSPYYFSQNYIDTQQAHIVDTRIISKLFRVEKEVKQEALSPLLYVLAFKPLLKLLNTNFKGISIFSQKFKTVAYVAD
ncbi:19559_t:CDS:1, partial [Dentiscutata erythropus]